MTIFIGQFLVTAGLLNRLAAPLIKERYRFIKEISFRIVDSHIVVWTAGRRSLIRFRGFAAARLVEFVFEPSAHRAGIRLNLEMQPRLLSPLFNRLLKKELTSRPGVSWSGDRLQLELDEMPSFTAIIRGTPGNSFFSQIEIAREKQGTKGGLLFNLYLHECGESDNGGCKGENKTSG